jgi:uncharacterized membrane protein YoaK (UPF0700 family)
LDPNQPGRSMQTHPRIILVGGCLLAALAAAVNVHFLLRVGVSVSHLTGDLARLGVDLARADRRVARDALWLATALGGFVLGAVAAGFFVHHPSFTLERPYGRAIASIGLLLVTAWGIEDALPLGATFCAAAGCGLQNGLATHYRGLVLRTTHVTGLLTDMGQMVGLRLAGHAVEPWKIGVQAAVCVAFLAGALGGALLSLRASGSALAVLGLCYVAGGLGWSLLKRRVLRIGRA